MSDPVIDKLTRFTPTTRADRDDLLFRAGRASAPSRRGWIGLSALLAAGQIATVALWAAQSRPTEGPHWPSAPVPASESPAGLRFDADSFGAFPTRWDAGRVPAPSVEPAPS